MYDASVSYVPTYMSCTRHECVHISARVQEVYRRVSMYVHVYARTCYMADLVSFVTVFVACSLLSTLMRHMNEIQ